MEKNYDYQNKIRKEVWVSKPAMKFITKLAKQEGRSIKAQLEVMLEEKIAEARADTKAA